MKKISFLIILIYTVAITSAQIIEKVDLKQIEKDISQEESSFYYPDLMNRYKASDTTLTAEEYKYLFYGYVFQKEYIPYGSHDSLEVMNSYWGNDIIAPNFNKLFELSGLILEDFPFEFNAIKTRIISAIETKDSIESKIWYQKYDKLLGTIFSSGDGRSFKTAFLVTQTSEEYEIVNVLGFYPAGQSLVEEKGTYYDLIDVMDNEYGIESLYFDISIFFGKLF